MISRASNIRFSQGTPNLRDFARFRKIPQDYSVDKYDELLARNEQGKLTHTIWEKP